MKNENDILQALADKADAENKERDAKIAKQYQGKKKSKKKNSKEKQQKEGNSPAEEIKEVSRATGEMEPISGMPLPEIKESPAKDAEEKVSKENPFDSLAEEMMEEGEALNASAKSVVQNSSEDALKKIKDVKSKEIGEEITKESAEKIISGKGKGGHRRTVIVRTQVVGSGEDAETKEEPPKPKKEEKIPPALRLVRPDTGESYDLSSDLTVGREDDNDVVIPNPEGHYVSAHHAEIQIQGRDIFVKDLSSTNGTYVNDRKIGSKRIRLGDIVEFADIKFEVVEG